MSAEGVYVGKAIQRLKRDADAGGRDAAEATKELVRYLETEALSLEQAQIVQEACLVGSERQQSLLELLDSSRLSKQRKQQITQILGLLAFNARSDIYFSVMFAELTDWGPPMSETREDRKKWLLLALKESIDKSTMLDNRDPQMSAVIDHMATSVMQQMELFLNSMDDEDYLPAVVDVLKSLAKAFPSYFDQQFKTIVDLLVGWDISGISQSHHEAVATFKPRWMRSVSFACDLLRNFVADMIPSQASELKPDARDRDAAPVHERTTKHSLIGVLRGYLSVLTAISDILKYPGSYPAAAMYLQVHFADLRQRTLDKLLEICKCDRNNHCASLVVDMLCQLTPLTVGYQPGMHARAMKCFAIQLEHAVSAYDQERYHVIFLALMKTLGNLKLPIEPDAIKVVLLPSESIITTIERTDLTTKIVSEGCRIIRHQLIPNVKETGFQQLVLTDCLRTSAQWLCGQSDSSPLWEAIGPLVQNSPSYDLASQLEHACNTLTTEAVPYAQIFGICQLLSFICTVESWGWAYDVALGTHNLMIQSIFQQVNITNRTKFGCLKAFAEALESTSLTASPNFTEHVRMLADLFEAMPVWTNFPLSFKIMLVRLFKSGLGGLAAMTTQRSGDTILEYFHRIRAKLLANAVRESNENLSVSMVEVCLSFHEQTHSPLRSLIELDNIRNGLCDPSTEKRTVFGKLLEWVPPYFWLQCSVDQNVRTTSVVEAQMSDRDSELLRPEHCTSLMGIFGIGDVDANASFATVMEHLTNIYSQYNAPTSSDLSPSHSYVCIMYWAAWQCAKACVHSKLRTTHGGPEKVFQLTERALRVALSSDDPSDKEKWLGSKAQTSGLLLFTERFILQIVAAASGRVIGSVHQTPQSVSAFFQVNQKTCLEWVKRVEPFMFHLFSRIGNVEATMLYGTKLLEDLASYHVAELPFDLSTNARILTCMTDALIEGHFVDIISAIPRWFQGNSSDVPIDLHKDLEEFQVNEFVTSWRFMAQNQWEDAQAYWLSSTVKDADHGSTTLDALRHVTAHKLEDFQAMSRDTRQEFVQQDSNGDEAAQILQKLQSFDLQNDNSTSFNQVSALERIVDNYIRRNSSVFGEEAVLVDLDAQSRFMRHLITSNQISPAPFNAMDDPRLALIALGASQMKGVNLASLPHTSELCRILEGMATECPKVGLALAAKTDPKESSFDIGYAKALLQRQTGDNDGAIYKLSQLVNLGIKHPDQEQAPSGSEVFKRIWQFLNAGSGQYQETEDADTLYAMGIIEDKLLQRAITQYPQDKMLWKSYGEYHYRRGTAIVHDLEAGEGSIAVTANIFALIESYISQSTQSPKESKELLKTFLRKTRELLLFDEEVSNLSGYEKHFTAIASHVPLHMSQGLLTELMGLRLIILAEYRQAMHGLFSFLKWTEEGNGSDLTTTMLKLINVLATHGATLATEFTTYAHTCEITPWLRVLPQLLVRLQHPHVGVRSVVRILVRRLAQQFPHQVIYPLLVCEASSKMGDIQKEAVGTVLNAIHEDNPNLVRTMRMFLGELDRCAVLWEEQWTQLLSSLQFDVVRIFGSISKEWRALDRDQSLDSHSRTRKKISFYGDALFPIIKRLKALQEKIKGPPITKHQIWFMQEFGRRIMSAMKAFESPVSHKDYKVGWDKWLKLLRQFTQLINRPRILKLEDISPRLANGSFADVWLPTSSQSATLVAVQSFVDQIVVLPTKTKPKKLVVQFDDGSRHAFLLKGLEDLHLDQRIMQFLSTSNEILYSPRAKNGQRRARTYHVIPINDHSGLIQWVENATPLYHLFRRWQTRDVPHNSTSKSTNTGGSTRANLPPSTSRTHCPRNVLRDVWDEMTKTAPLDLLHLEIWASSVNAKDRFRKIQAYTQSVAVMSILGYIVGLGDRHLDNILLDAQQGEIIHIDYNVCFEKGASLRIPEVVPFRLTKNLVKALGFNDVQGSFKEICIATLRSLRSHEDILVHLMDTFVYDPLLDWQKELNKQAEDNVKEIRSNFLSLRRRIKESLPHLKPSALSAKTVLKKLKQTVALGDNSDLQTTLSQLMRATTALQEFIYDVMPIIDVMTAMDDDLVDELPEVRDIARTIRSSWDSMSEEYNATLSWLESTEADNADSDDVDIQAMWTTTKIDEFGSAMDSVLSNLRRFLDVDVDDKTKPEARTGAATKYNLLPRGGPESSLPGSGRDGLSTQGDVTVNDSSSSQNAHTQVQQRNAYAMKIVKRVQEKLDGKDWGQQLDVEAQVTKIIHEATNPDNLCRMFEGWTSWV
ncbi:hypothetical protein BZG36_02378 [Bifiguratus adelaidae]|uniref:non-specific serine/threonine protein kinase n=1 Tax=Bifiguratus adelaidae TaxID=1938954 RepID=A0A261Y132_9FUNG|nr:hypothetical protein BZG36_02378 [Bifiguratus adelaidae]